MIAKNYYELGNLFFTQFNRLDSAYFYYDKLLSDYPNSEYKARTLFAVGSYFESEGDKAKADSIYNVIYDQYKDEAIVNAAADKLKKPLIDLSYDPAKDLYTKAEQKMKSEEYASSAKDFYNIYLDYPSSSLAPKALYATGWILENELNMYDSAAVVYDSVLTKFPQSTYALKVRPKVQFYKAEKERIKRAREDSLRIIEQARLDSLKADSIKANNKNIQVDPTLPPTDSTQINNQNSFPPPPDDEQRIDERNDAIIDSMRRDRNDLTLPEKVDEKVDSIKAKK